MKKLIVVGFVLVSALVTNLNVLNSDESAVLVLEDLKTSALANDLEGPLDPLEPIRHVASYGPDGKICCVRASWGGACVPYNCGYIN